MSKPTVHSPSAELKYFGAVMAVISHDIKNTLSIIGENAGLFQDLVGAVSHTGRPPDLDKLNTIAERITKHAARADRIVKRMNAFAHSADDPLRELDVVEMAQLAARVGQRRWNSAELEIRIAAPEEPIRLTCPPFALLHAIWMCLELLTRCPAEDRNVTVEVCGHGHSVALKFNPLGPLDERGETLLDDLRETLPPAFTLQQNDGWLELEIADPAEIADQSIATERSS